MDLLADRDLNKGDRNMYKVKEYNKLHRNMFTTIVDPSEYDLDSDMIEAMKLSIKEKSPYILMDIGKMVGLWQAYKDLPVHKDKHEAQSDTVAVTYQEVHERRIDNKEQGTGRIHKGEEG